MAEIRLTVTLTLILTLTLTLTLILTLTLALLTVPSLYRHCTITDISLNQITQKLWNAEPCRTVQESYAN